MDSPTPTSLHIPTCRHILDRGCLCRGAAVRGRTYCRHHLHTQVRLRKMARALRSTRGLGSFSLTSAAAIEQTQVQLRVALAAGRIDRDSARTISSALLMVRSLNHAIEREKRRSYRVRAPLSNPNKINYVPVTPVNPHIYPRNRAQVPENNRVVGVPQPRWKPSKKRTARTFWRLANGE